MMSLRARQILIPLLLIVGVQGWLLLHAALQRYQVPALGVALLLAVIPPVHRWVFGMIQRLRRAEPRARALTAVAIFVASFGYLAFTALHQQRDLFPKYHDNQSYAIQAKIIASGRLWLPAHEHPDFFDTFHVIVAPVYASMYFPGAAMLYAVGVLLRLPFWITAIAIAAGCVALVYRVVAEVVDNVAGLLAALWLVSLVWFRHLSAMLMSHSVLLLLGLAMFWAYLRWRRGRRLRWALIVGAFSGFAAITRPADALCYALPIGVAMLWEYRGAWAWGKVLAMCGTIVAGAAPFLFLQVVFNLGVTGKPFESPYRFYLDRDAPQLSFGFHTYDPTRVAKSVIEQKRLYHRDFNGNLIRNHRPELLLYTWFDRYGRLLLIIESTSPTLLALPLLLVGLLGLRTPGRVALFVVLPLYCLLYLFYAALLRHYTPAIAPATILIGVMAARELEFTWPRARAAVATFATLATAGLCITVLPEMNPHMKDDPFPYPEVTDARENIPKNVKAPALVFVRFVDRQGENVHAEPVYNYTAARIDDNPIIYAHDLGSRNVELLMYYLTHQPDRSVYIYDRPTRRLIPRGSLVDELKRLSARPATTRAASTTGAP